MSHLTLISMKLSVCVCVSSLFLLFSGFSQKHGWISEAAFIYKDSQTQIFDIAKEDSTTQTHAIVCEL